MHTNSLSDAAETILRRRWQELRQNLQQAQADECNMAETVLFPQPGSLPLAGHLSLTDLADFVPSGDGLVGEYEQALHQLAVMSFRVAVHNLMIAAQTGDSALRDTHRQLANWHSERSAKLTHELQRFRTITTEIKRVPGSSATKSVPAQTNMATEQESVFAATSIVAAPAIEPTSTIESPRTPAIPPENLDEPWGSPEPRRFAILPARSRRAW